MSYGFWKTGSPDMNNVRAVLLHCQRLSPYAEASNCMWYYAGKQLVPMHFELTCPFRDYFANNFAGMCIKLYQKCFRL